MRAHDCFTLPGVVQSRVPVEFQTYAKGAHRAVCQQFVSTRRRPYDTVDKHMHIARTRAYRTHTCTERITGIENTFEMAAITEPHDPLRVKPIEC